MKITISKTDLKEAIASALLVTPKNSSISVMECLLITAADHAVRIYAADIGISVCAAVLSGQATVLEEGRACVDARTLSGVVGRLNEEEITLGIGSVESGLRVTCGGGTVRLPCRPVSEFPQAELVTTGAHVRLPRYVYADALRRAAYAAGDDQSRAIFTGVIIRMDDARRLHFTTTDGAQLADIALDVDIDGDFEPVSVPASSLRAALALASSGCAPVAEPIELYIDPDRGAVSMRTLGGDVCAKVIAGVAPDLGRVMEDPGPSAPSMRVDMDPIKWAISAATVTAGKRMHARIEAAGWDAAVTAASEKGDARYAIPTASDGGRLKFTVDARRLLRILDAEGTGGEVMIRQADEDSPLIIRVARGDDADGRGSATHVLMPIRA